MYWQTAEFNEDITKYNYIQLADWIERCRLVVSKQKYIQEQKTHEEYLNDVFGFSYTHKNAHDDSIDSIATFCQRLIVFPQGKTKARLIQL